MHVNEKQQQQQQKGLLRQQSGCSGLHFLLVANGNSANVKINQSAEVIEKLFNIFFWARAGSSSVERVSVSPNCSSFYPILIKSYSFRIDENKWK